MSHYQHQKFPEDKSKVTPIIPPMKNNHEHKSWKLGSDCCSWDGVTCDRLTGHVIGLDLSSSQLIGKIHVNSSIFLLHHIRSLNLACYDFMFSEISSNFAQFTKLIHLNLSSSNFSGLVPSEISHLSKLGSLDLSDNNAGHGLEIGQHCFNKILQNLTEVRYLLLDNVNMSSVVPGFLVNFSSLISLSLSNTQLRHEFPNGVFRLPFLQQLSLSRNGGLIGNLPESNWSSPLRLLDQSLTKFSGILPETIGDLIHLNVLDFLIANSRIQFQDHLEPHRKLTRLSFAHNSFSGQFPDVLGNLSKVIEIYLFDNNFSGQLPLSAFNLTQVSHLHFSHNEFVGHLPYQKLCSPEQSSAFSVSRNFTINEYSSFLRQIPGKRVVIAALGMGLLVIGSPSCDWT
ncbi:receptor-like protein 7 [Pistacia vera]|uniref:receptor-like protein 7 n=1 Tax=Pistacia vera TaxID=55513 RepID=UPI001263AEBB|nr:receptor-like protein 7 [Pistacia vera]